MVTECQILVKGTVVVGCLGFLVAGDYSLWLGITEFSGSFGHASYCLEPLKYRLRCSKTNWATRSWVKQQTFSVRTSAAATLGSRRGRLWRKQVGFPDVILFENGVTQFTIPIFHCTISGIIFYVIWYFKNVCEYSFSNTAATAGLKSCKECSPWPCLSGMSLCVRF